MQFTNNETKAPNTNNWGQEPKKYLAWETGNQRYNLTCFCSSWFLVSAALVSVAVHRPASIRPYDFPTYLFNPYVTEDGYSWSSRKQNSLSLSLWLYYIYVYCFFSWSQCSLKLFQQFGSHWHRKRLKALEGHLIHLFASRDSIMINNN